MYQNRYRKDCRGKKSEQRAAMDGCGGQQAHSVGHGAGGKCARARRGRRGA